MVRSLFDEVVEKFEVLAIDVTRALPPFDGGALLLLLSLRLTVYMFCCPAEFAADEVMVRTDASVLDGESSSRALVDL